MQIRKKMLLPVLAGFMILSKTPRKLSYIGRFQSFGDFTTYQTSNITTHRLMRAITNAVKEKDKKYTAPSA